MALILDDQNTSATNETSMGDSSGSIEMATLFQASVTFPVGKITIKCRKAGSPVDNVFIKIYADSSGPGVQIGGNSNVIAGSTLTGTETDTDFTWTSNEPNLVSGTNYWLSFTRSGAADGTNFYEAEIGNLYRSTNYEKFSPWTNPANNFSMYFKEYYDNAPKTNLLISEI